MLALFPLLLFTATVSAQDTIYQRDGKQISGKVLNVSSREVSYKNAANPDGPEYKLPMRDVTRIVYQDGSEDKRIPGTAHMRHRQSVPPKSHTSADYKNNIAAVSLLSVSDAGMTMGLSYERILDKKGIVSVYLPVAYYLKTWGNDNDYVLPGPSLNRDSRIFEFRPAVKVYPFNARGKVRYAVGPQLSYTDGHFRRDFFRVSSPSFNVAVKRVGMLLNQSLMLQPSPYMYIGLEGGFGYTFSNKSTEVVYGPYGDIKPGVFREMGTTRLAHLIFSIGYRF